MKKPGLYMLTAIMLLALQLLPPAAVCAAVPSLGALTDAGYRQVLGEIADQVVTRLPDDIHFRLLGIAAIEGDDGRLVDALTSRIKAKTRYHLVERKDLDKILKEQGVQLSPIADPDAPVRPGKIMGIEGLLLGRIDKKRCSIFFCSMDVFIKLDDVEKGEVRFADHFTAVYVPLSTRYGLVAAALLVMVGVLYYRRSSASRKQVRAADGLDAKDRLVIQSALKRVRDNLNRAHDHLVGAGHMQAGVAVHEIREEVETLLLAVEQAPGPHGSRDDAKAMRAARANLNNLAQQVKEMFVYSEKLVRASVDGDERSADRAVHALREEVKNAANGFHERTLGRT